MKTILVDAIHVLLSEGGVLNADMYQLLESYPNPKIVVTGANKEQAQKYGLDRCPYPVFTCEHNPEKSEPEYFKILMREYQLKATDIVYFDHTPQAISSAGRVGISTFLFNAEVNDILALKAFLDSQVRR